MKNQTASMLFLLFSVLLFITIILPVSSAAAADNTPRLAPDLSTRKQAMIGVGAALTESSILAMSRLSENKTTELLRTFFDPARAPFSSSSSPPPTSSNEQQQILGGNFAAVRVPISSTDFSLFRWTYDDDNNDVMLRNFSLEQSVRDRTAPVLKQIRAIRPDVFFLATPWTAPAWMKDPDTNRFNSSAFTNLYAKFLVRAVSEFQTKLGIALDALTLVNEPHNSNPSYPTMLLSADQAASVARAYIMECERAKRRKQQPFPLAPPARLLLWDHNWDDAAYPVRVLSLLLNSSFIPASQQHLVFEYVMGAAFHCYAGDPSAQLLFKNNFSQYPHSFMIAMSECCGGSWAPNFGDNLVWDAKMLTLGSVKYGSSLVLKFNIALDHNHGPKAPGGCADCRGVVTVDNDNNSNNNNDNGTVTFNEDYAALAHLGAVIASQSNTTARIGTDMSASSSSSGISAESFVSVPKGAGNASARYSMMILNENTEQDAIEIVHPGNSSCTATLSQVPVGLVSLTFSADILPTPLRWFVTSKNQSEVLSRRPDVNFVC